MAGCALHFHCARGLATRVLAHVSDSLVRVSRRVGCARSVSRRRTRDAPAGSPEPRLRVCLARPAADDPRRQSAPRQEAGLSRRREAGRKRVSSCRFQALFNSLFKVLCIFPSRYLFAIGLGVIFSLTRSLPRTLSCTPKQLDSRSRPAKQRNGHYGPSTLYGIWPLSRGLERVSSLR